MFGSKKSSDSNSDSKKSAKKPVTAQKGAAKKAMASKGITKKLSPITSPKTISKKTGQKEEKPEVKTPKTSKKTSASKGVSKKLSPITSPKTISKKNGQKEEKPEVKTPKTAKKAIAPPIISVSDTKKGDITRKVKTDASPKTKQTVSKPRQQPATAEKNFYSDADLLEFKELIDLKLAAAKEELRLINEEVIRVSEMGSEDRHFNPEEVSGSIEREHLSQIALRQVQYIQHLENALIRIKNKSYGICRVTGKLIAKDRLRAVPHATLSMEAKLSQK